MTFTFNKYQGTGNDFIIIDNRDGRFNPADNIIINKLCDRRFGIGADGFILVSDHKDYDFEMKYFNADGNLGSMCGNGGRCASNFSLKKGIAGKNQKFLAADGVHESIAEAGIVQLKMSDVIEYKIIEGNYFINTGSPHYVIFRSELDNTNVSAEGRMIRHSHAFKPGGTNVNFVELYGDGIYVRTFERGVEDETLSCGTGVTASAIATMLTGHFDTKTVRVKTRGGDLSVSATVSGNIISDIWLYGPATFVFEGKIDI